MKKNIALLFLAAAVGSCMTLSPQYRFGAAAEMNKQWDEAIAFYEKASLENPRDPVYRLALQRAKLGASLHHLQEARRRVAEGKLEEAKAEYAKAIEYNPRDTAIQRELRQRTTPGAEDAESKPEKIEFPIKLKAKDEPLQLRFPGETSLRAIFLALGKAGGISIVFDEGFRDVPTTFDLSNMTVEQALKSMCLASRNFYRIVDPRTVIVIPDNQMKRLQYEASCIKTFYLSNVSAQEMMASLSQLLRSQTKIPMMIFDKNLNSLTVRDTAQSVELAEKLIRVLDKPKSEVVIDVEILEVSRLTLREIGQSFDSSTIGLRYGNVSNDATSTTTWTSLGDIDFSKAGNFSISLPVSYVQFLESDSDTRIIAQPRLRGVSDEENRYLVGQKIPFPQTSFSPIAAGGISVQPMTSYTQQDVGIEVKVTPKVHFEKEVTLAMEIKVTSVGGTGYADIPIINTRELKSTLRLKDGETNLIAGLLKDEERKSIKGIPGLKDIPLLGRLFGMEDTTVEQTDVIMMITPYIIRSIPIGPEDGKAIWVDVDTVAANQIGEVGGLEMLDPGMGMVNAPRPSPQRPGGEGVNTVSLSPSNAELRAGQNFRMAVNVDARGGQEIGTLSVTIQFNPAVLNLRDVAEGIMTRQAGGQAPFLKNIDNNSGICVIGFTSSQMGKGSRGGSLATLQFEAKGQGEGTVTITGVQGTGPTGQPIQFRTQGARVAVR